MRSHDHALRLLARVFCSWPTPILDGGKQAAGRQELGRDRVFFSTYRREEHLLGRQPILVRSFASATCQGRKGKEICGNDNPSTSYSAEGTSSSLAFSDRPKGGIQRDRLASPPHMDTVYVNQPVVFFSHINEPAMIRTSQRKKRRSLLFIIGKEIGFLPFHTLFMLFSRSYLDMHAKCMVSCWNLDRTGRVKQ